MKYLDFLPSEHQNKQSCLQLCTYLYTDMETTNYISRAFNIFNMLLLIHA